MPPEEDRATASRDLHAVFCDDWSSGSRDMYADRLANWSQYPAPLPGQSNKSTPLDMFVTWMFLCIAED